MTPRLLGDADLAAHVTPQRARTWMAAAVRAAHRGDLAAPPRVHADLGGRTLALTAGALTGSWFGYRVYAAPGDGADEQVTVVNDARGAVRGVHVGTGLGPLRVGAIGAVAATLAPPDAPVAVLGAGTQAWHQVWALAGTRDVTHCRVFAPRPDARQAFAARITGELGVPAQAAPSAEAAVRGAGLVVLATSSATPVIDVSWLDDGAYVTTLGPKQVGRSEIPPGLLERARVVVTDSPAQLAAYDPPHVLAGHPSAPRIAHLGAALDGEATPASSGDLTLFLSVGLAGTEAYLLAELLDLLDALPA